MKKYILIIFISTLSINAKSQYSKIFDFNDSLGENPIGSLLYDGTFFYGMTSDGGSGTNCLTGNCGVVFKIKPDGSGYLKLLDFNEDDGAYPHGSLISDGIYLYGMTYKGGEFGEGVIFKIKTDGTGYFKLLDFNGENGSHPKGTLFYDGTYLYGMTVLGGSTDHGVIFKINPDGTGYTILHEFDPWITGNGPYGTLIYDGTFLYGMTVGGGSYDKGVVFKIMPDGTEYMKLHDFNGENGRSPWGNLISDSIFLYGMTYNGGSYENGVIFRIKPDGSEFTKLIDLNNEIGSHPEGSLIFHGKVLYGLTHWGGTTSDCTFECGVLFKINTDGTGFSTLYNFGDTNGSDPKGDLFAIGQWLYGMTYQGGPNHRGAIFKYGLDKQIGEEENVIFSDSIIIYPNPFSNYITISGTNDKGVVVINDVYGREIIHQQTLNFKTIINIQNVAKGFYFLQYIDDGNIFSNYKLVKL